MLDGCGEPVGRSSRGSQPKVFLKNAGSDSSPASTIPCFFTAKENYQRADSASVVSEEASSRYGLADRVQDKSVQAMFLTSEVKAVTKAYSSGAIASCKELAACRQIRRYKHIRSLCGRVPMMHRRVPIWQTVAPVIHSILEVQTSMFVEIFVLSLGSA